MCLKIAQKRFEAKKREKLKRPIWASFSKILKFYHATRIGKIKPTETF